jgi:hypothetical protein
LHEKTTRRAALGEPVWEALPVGLPPRAIEYLSRVTYETTQTHSSALSTQLSEQDEKAPGGPSCGSKPPSEETPKSRLRVEWATDRGPMKLIYDPSTQTLRCYRATNLLFAGVATLSEHSFASLADLLDKITK